LHLCTCLRRLGVPFIAPKGLGAVGASFGSSQPSLVAGAPDRLLFTVLCTGQVTIHCSMHRTQHYSLFYVPDTATIHCPVHRTGHYSLSCAPDRVIIHCPVHRTELLFTVLCTGQSYYSLSCAPDSYYSLSCAPANSTLSAFSSVFSPFDFNFWEDFSET
jgi:hypothetical protein